MGRILIASSDHGLVEILSAELAGEGHEVECAYDGQDAYSLALAGNPDVVFLEVSLPVFNGYETCRMLRGDPDIPSTLPIIFLTTPDADRKAMQKAGATDYLPKQHEARELRELLTRHLSAEATPDAS